MQALHRRYRNLSRAQRHAIEEYEAIQAEHAEIESFDIDHHLQCHSTRTHARTHARKHAHTSAHTRACVRVCACMNTHKNSYTFSHRQKATHGTAFLCAVPSTALIQCIGRRAAVHRNLELCFRVLRLHDLHVGDGKSHRRNRHQIDDR
jgi:hypothetical protein